MQIETSIVRQEAPTLEVVSEELAAAAAVAPTTTEEALAAAKGEATPKVAERPADVPEKFWNAEKGEVDTAAILKSYSELEKNRPAPAMENEGAAEEQPKEEEEGEKKPDAETPSKPAEVVASLTKTYAEKGEFGDADYAMAEAAGFDRATVDAYVAGQQALADAATRQITEAAGGKENMDRMFAWASTALTVEQVAEYNKSFEGGDVAAAVIAMGKLKADYEAVYGRDASKNISGKPDNGSTDVYTSWAEVSRAMEAPEYAKDPAYRKKVEQKLARSSPR